MIDAKYLKERSAGFRQKATRSFLTYSIILVGVLLLMVTILDFIPLPFLEGYEQLQTKITSGLFYSCLGLICIILGLERALDIARIEESLYNQNKVLSEYKEEGSKLMKQHNDLLSSIDQHISGYRQYKLLDNYTEIYNLSLQLALKAQTNIRSVVYANSPKAPDSWNTDIAKILKAKADSGNPVQFDVVVCINQEDFNSQTIEQFDKRFQLYKNEGAEKYHHRYFQFMEKTIGLDCFIIDDMYMILSFPLILSNKTQKAILLENQKETITAFNNWFTSYAMFESLSFNNAVKMYNFKNSHN